jgi:hypothetical protein
MNTTVPLIHEKKDRWASCFDPNIDLRERTRFNVTPRGQRIGLLIGLALVVLGVFCAPSDHAGGDHRHQCVGLVNVT